MTDDPINGDASAEGGEPVAPPLCLVYFLAGHTTDSPAPPQSLSVPPRRVRVAERRDNLIVLDFADPPAMQSVPHGKRWEGTQARKTRLSRGCDWLTGLLLLATLYACLAALRF